MFVITVRFLILDRFYFEFLCGSRYTIYCPSTGFADSRQLHAVYGVYSPIALRTSSIVCFTMTLHPAAPFFRASMT